MMPITIIFWISLVVFIIFCAIPLLYSCGANFLSIMFSMGERGVHIYNGQLFWTSAEVALLTFMFMNHESKNKEKN